MTWRGERQRLRAPDNTKQSALSIEARMRDALTRTGSIKELDPRLLRAEATFAEYAEKWSQDYVLTNNKPSERVSKQRVLSSSLVPFFGAMRLRDITAHDAERFKACLLKQGVTPKTVNNHLCVLRRALQIAVDWEVLDRIPRIKFLKVQRNRRAPIPFQAIAPIAAAAESPFWTLLILVVGYLGLRFDEAIALKWSDLALESDPPQVMIRRSYWRGHLTDATKTYREREIPLPKTATAAFRALPRIDELVFSYNGGYVPYATALKKLHAASLKAGPRRIGWHILRHTYLTELGRLGVELHTIQEMAGHSDIRTTRMYLKILPEMKARAAALLDPPRSVPVGLVPAGSQEFASSVSPLPANLHQDALNVAQNAASEAA